MTDIQILRELAREYWRAVQEDRERNILALHKAVNDLHMIRPVVLIDELPWHELNVDGSLTLRCEDPCWHGAEWFFRSTLYKYRHFRADMTLRPYFPVYKVVRSTGIGLEVQEAILSKGDGNDVVSHEYTDILPDEAALEKIHPPVITYDEEKTRRQYQMYGDAFGDILPIRICGLDHPTVVTWDDIARYRGVENLLIDLAERPEFCHDMVRRLTDCKLSEMEQYERLGLFDSDPYSLHCTAIATDDLPHENPVTRKGVWGRGAAQIFASVGKDMHEEFDIEYMKETIGSCGLVYYGCCEPLDKKIDIVEKIPHLRKISITPWADIHIAAEAIGKRYVIACKPNPAAVGVSRLNQDALRKEIQKILDACARNGCSFDLVLKDISTCGGRPENIMEWEAIVMDMVTHY